MPGAILSVIAGHDVNGGLVFDSLGGIYGLKRNTNQLAKANGAAWNYLTAGTVEPGVDPYLYMTTNDTPYMATFNANVYQYGGGAWATTSLNTTGLGATSFLSACAVGTDLYCFVLDVSNTLGRVIKFDGAVWSAVTPFADAAPNGEPLGSLFVFGGEVYLLSLYGSIYHVTGGTFNTRVALAIWTDANQFINSVLRVTAITGGKIYIGCAPGGIESTHAASLWSWNGSAATWAIESAYNSIINQYPCRVGLHQGAVYLVNGPGGLYHFAGGTLVNLTATGGTWAQVFSNTADLLVFGSDFSNTINIGKYAAPVFGNCIMPSFVSGF